MAVSTDPFNPATPVDTTTALAFEMQDILRLPAGLVMAPEREIETYVAAELMRPWAEAISVVPSHSLAQGWSALAEFRMVTVPEAYQTPVVPWVTKTVSVKALLLDRVKLPVEVEVTFDRAKPGMVGLV